MVQRSRLHPTQSGISGEYFVAAELSRLGYIASLSLNPVRKFSAGSDSKYKDAWPLLGLGPAAA